MTDDISSLALSRFAVCEASALAMVDALLAHFDEHRDTKHFRYWLGTFCFDDGVIQINDGFLSQAAVECVKLKVYKALHEYGVHAIYKVEVEILLRIVEEDSTRLMYHVHAACWRHGDPIKPRKLAKAMMRGKRFTNDLGAPTVTFLTNRRPRGEPGTSLEPSKKRLPPTERSVAGLAAYITKWPACVTSAQAQPVQAWSQPHGGRSDQNQRGVRAQVDRSAQPHQRSRCCRRRRRRCD